MIRGGLLTFSGSAAVDRRVWMSRSVSRACPRKFVANWISKPSSETDGGVAMMPALSIRMSRRDEAARNCEAAARTDVMELLSHLMNVTGTEEAMARAEAMVFLAEVALRPLK